MSDELKRLNQKQTAALMGVSIRKFQREQSKGFGPVASVTDKSRWWTRAGVRAWERNERKDNQTLNPALG